jgi:hypothetical protein
MAETQLIMKSFTITGNGKTFCIRLISSQLRHTNGGKRQMGAKRDGWER